LNLSRIVVSTLEILVLDAMFVPLEPYRCVAIFPYEAQQEDELSFPADAILEILDPVNTSGWFKAQLGDRIGLVPSTYMQSLNTPNPCK
jgi:hypothetical protein